MRHPIPIATILALALTAAARAQPAEPANDDCENATPIGDGTVVGTTAGATPDGAATCGSSYASPDVWFRYTSASGGTVFADTFGSGFDTVLSVHFTCPGTPDTEITCSDNAAGLQSAVESFLAVRQEIFLRVSGFAGSAGPFALHVGPGGGIAGRVTTAPGQPLPSVSVRIFDRRGSLVASSESAATGGYAVDRLASGTYFAVAGIGTDFVPEVYRDMPCAAGRCAPAGGTPIEVRLGELTSGVDFALEPGGTISGAVRDAASSFLLRWDVT